MDVTVTNAVAPPKAMVTHDVESSDDAVVSQLREVEEVPLLELLLLVVP